MMIISNAHTGKINEYFCIDCVAFKLVQGFVSSCQDCGSSAIILAKMGTLDGEEMRKEVKSEQRDGHTVA